MKLNILIATLVLSTFIASSCSTFNEIIGRQNSEKNTTTEQSATLTPSKTNKQTAQSRGKKSQILKEKTTVINTTKSKETVVTEIDSVEIVNKLSGEWYFDKIGNVKVTGDDDWPTLTFDYAKQRFYANNGCNYFNGDYSLGAGNSLSFYNVISTTNICEGLQWIDAINSLWSKTAHFETAANDTYEKLILKDRYNRIIAEFKRHRLATINGLWEITEINGRKLDERPNINIDLIEKTIYGNTGCNIFNGKIYQDPDVEMSIQFQDMAVTRMSCPQLSTETALLVALEQTERAMITDNDTVILVSETGRHLVTMHRLSI